MVSLDRWILGLIVGLGLLWPWVTAAVMTLYLQARGQPTLQWSGFLTSDALLIEVPFTIFLASPYLILAATARKAFQGGALPFVRTMSPAQRRAVVLVSLGVGSLATVMMYVSIFQEFEVLYFFTPIPVLQPAFGLIVGWGLGLAVVGLSRYFRNHRNPPPPPVGSD